MLTAKQLNAKQKAEAAGQVFIPPSQYKAMVGGAKPKAAAKRKAAPMARASAAMVMPQQVASYNAKRNISKMNEVAPETEQLIDQILNPEDCNDTTRWPNTYGLSATYKCKNVINARFSSDNRCCVAVNPTVKDSIFTTTGSPQTVQLNPYAAVGSDNPFGIQSLQLIGNNNIVDYSSPIILPNRQATIPFPYAPAQGLLYPANFSIGASTVNVRLSVRFMGAISSQAFVRFVTYDVNHAVVTDSNFQPIGSIGGPSGFGYDFDSSITPANATQIQYFSLQFRGTVLPFIGDVIVFFVHPDNPNPNSAQMIVPNHAQHVTIYDIRDADTISDSASQAFVLAQSLLITAQMSDLNNGGTLAIARVPGTTVIGEGDDEIDFTTWYEWIASLPYNSYDGAVKNGGYCWYLPEDETGFFYRPLDTYFSKELPYMVSEFTVSDQTEASIVRIKVCTIVQFTTTSSVYDCRPSSHIRDVELMHHLLSLIPASYTNEGHKEQIKRIFNKVKGVVVKLLKNPKTYTTLVQMAPLIAAALI